MSISLAIIMAAASPATIPVQAAPAPAATVDAAQSAAALELAEVLNSEALTRVQLDKMIDETIPAAFAQNPEMTALDKAYPGATAAVLTAMRPVLIDYTIKELPAIWRELAPIYARSFTPGELSQLLEFYKGPTGVRLVAAMGRGSDYGATIDRMMLNGNNKVTSDDLKAASEGGVATAIRTATKEDMAAMIALMDTSAGRKMPAVTRATQDKIAEISNRSALATEALMQKVVADALQAHIAKSKKP